MNNNKPALFVPIRGEWIDEAFDYFKKGKERLYFATDSRIAKAQELPIKTVYFKLKGETYISFKADFIDALTENPVNLRLRGSERFIGKYYYGFRSLRPLKISRELQELERFESGKTLRNDTPGVCFIIDPESE